MKCPECKSTKIINTQKEDYCSECGLVLTTYYEYTGGVRVEYPLGFKRWLVMDNLQGNISTVLVALYAILAPYISQYMSQEVFLSVCGLILVIWSAYNPNTFKILGNDNTCECEQIVDEEC